MLRIISGKHRGRMMNSSSLISPTMGRTKDAIFKILNSGSFSCFLQGAKFVDLFCGTGAVALEALSRGARHAVMIDNNPEFLNIARKNAEFLEESENVTILCSDILRSNKATVRKLTHDSNIVFIDAPYDVGLINKVLVILLSDGLISDNAVIVLEMSKMENIKSLLNFEVLVDRLYGKSRILIIKKIVTKPHEFQ